MIKLNANRYILPEVIKHYNYKNGLEIGVQSGHFTRFLLQNCPNVKLQGVDPFLESGTLNWGWGFHDDNIFETQERANEYHSTMLSKTRGFENYTFYHSKSIDFAVNCGVIDFLMIDGDHSEEGVYNDLCAFYDKLSPNGFICGHDYCGDYGNSEPVVSVKPAVDRFCSERHIDFFVTNDNFNFMEGMGCFFIKKNYDESDLFTLEKLSELNRNEYKSQFRLLADRLSFFSNNKRIQISVPSIGVYDWVKFQNTIGEDWKALNINNDGGWVWRKVGNDVHISRPNIHWVIYNIEDLMNNGYCGGTIFNEPVEITVRVIQ